MLILDVNKVWIARALKPCYTFSFCVSGEKQTHGHFKLIHLNSNQESSTKWIEFNYSVHTFIYNIMPNMLNTALLELFASLSINISVITQLSNIKYLATYIAHLSF